MRKKFLLMTFLLAIIGFCGTNLRAQGDLQIATETALRGFANAVNSGVSYEGRSVTLTDDITLTGEWTPIGNGSRDSKTYTDNAFKGTFDGGNHTISGLTISSTTGADVAVGLFGIVDGGTVKNLNLTDVSINVTNSNLAGAAIGMMLNGATANNITVSGAIVGNDGVGGIVGRLIIDGTISNCTNNASVTSSYGGIGGIVGKPYYEDGANTSTFASITNCTNNGTITAPMYIGGIAGLARANVTNCTNNGAVVGGTQTGGIVGQLIAAGTVSGNENKAKVSGKNHLGGIIGDYSQSNAYTYYNVSIANNINRGELAATEQCAAIMGCNNIDGFTAMTATGNVSYYYVEGLELFGNPEDMVIDATNKFVVPVAQVGEQTFYTFAEAADAAQAGSEIKLLANIEGDITVPANVTLNGNDFTISGAITADGTITFAGVTKATNFGVKYVNTVVNIPAGASLQLTGTGRMVIGHGCTFNITGSIADNAAKTADKATLTPSLVMPGASFTGAGVTFNVTNAYISAHSSYCSSSSSASGTFDFNITNSIWESAGKLAFESQSTAATVNFDLVESVLNTGSHLVFGVSRGEVVIDNSNVNVGTSRQIENQSTMTIKNGSVVNGAVATSSNAKNPGTLIVENATYAVTGEFSGSDLGTGTLIMKNGASFTAGSITKANIQIDATGMAIGDEINLTANLTNLAGTLEVINNDNLDAEIKDGKIVLVEKPVAKIGETEYATLQAALNAAAQTEELTTIQLLAGTHTFGNVKFPATLKNVTIVGADNKATIIKDSKLYSADGNAVTYKGITFDGIVFDNSSILFTGARNGEVVYEDWTIKKCDFRNLQSTDGIAAIHFNLAADETIKNFTFEKNTITNVTSPSNTASGLRLNYVTGDVVIKDNETNNVAFNAVQIINSEVDNFTFEGNILRSNGSSLANLYNVTGENIVITKNQFLANEDQKSVSNIAYADVSGNYWGGGAPTNLPEGVVCSSYYTTVESDGTLGGLVELPQGNNFTGYTRTDAIWGEVWGNASNSFVIKVLDANGNVMGTTSLNNIGGIIDGDVNVTWNIKLDAASNTDNYWTMAWTTAPTIGNMPAKVELWVDGVKVSGGNVVLNGPDEINKIYAAVTDNDGKIYSYHTSIANAVDAITGTRSVTPNVIALLRDTNETVTLPAGIALNLNGFTAANVSVPVAQIGETPYYTLAEAVAAAESGETITLLNGEHELPLFAGKELTFKGESKEGVIVNDAPAAVTQGWNGSTFHFENLTAKGATANYHGLANGVVAVTYKDCIIKGLRFLYATNGVSFEDCTFNAEGVEHSFWTYGASNVTVTDCTFTYTDRAVNCYSENGENHELDITFTGCTFSYAGTDAEPEGAVEINSGSVKSIDLVMNGCTAPANGAMWFNSQWDSKKGENTVVTIDDEIVWQVLPVAKIGDVQYKSLQAALDAAAAGTGNVTVEILRNIDLTGIDWNPVTVSGPGYPLVTIEGNNDTITGLNDMLFAGTWAGNSGLIINNLTIANSNIVNDKDDTKGTVGVGAFIGYPQASETITLNNCHLKDSHVEGGHWTGGLIGMAGGYNGNDGPVFMNLTIEGCSVTGSTITGKGSCGGIIGHGSCAAWTDVNIQNTTVSGNTVTSTGSSTNKAGAIMGTIGAAGQPTTVNGVTHTGGATVSATVSGNTVTSGSTTITTIYGRQGTETGMLELAGGSYDKYPIEENVTYAAPVEGYEIVENTNGTYGVEKSAVAKIGDVEYKYLQAAFDAAQNDATIMMIADVTVAEEVIIDNTEKAVTLDMNGKTWNGAIKPSNAKLTIKNGTINNENVSISAIEITSGELNLNGVNIASARHAVRIDGDVEATINGGTYKAAQGSGKGTYHAANISGNANVTIEDGTFVGPKGTSADSGSAVKVQSGATVTIEDGDFSKGKNNTLSVDGTLTVKGGTFDQNPSDYVPTGYTTQILDNGKYEVLYAIASIGTKYYADLHEAMVEAKAGETVKLVNDVDLAGTEWEPVSFKGIFDGQDHIISNLTINKPGVSNTGFITSLNGTFKNVTFTNPTVTGGDCTAVVAGRAGGGAAYAHNITINGTIKVETTHSGYARTGGIVGGWAYGKYENITIDGGDKDTSYIKHTGGGDGRYVAGIVGHADDVESYTNCTVKNITISGGWLCGGIAGPGPADGLATGCSVENIDMGADYSGGMFGWYYGDGTIKDATVKDVTFTDGSTCNGAIGGYSNNEDATVKNVTIDNVKNENGAPIFTFAATIADGTDIYYYATLEAAFTAATEGQTITLLGNCDLSETIKVNNNITLDLNGDTITGTDNATGSFALIEIQPGAELIIEDSSEPSTGNITLTSTNNREWNAYSSVISNQRGKLTVNGGTIEHLGGTDMAYGIDNLTNGKGTYAETVINGGTIKSTYRGIRQFLNGTEAENILTVNGGTIEGTNKSIWMQDPNKNANTGTLTVGEEANLIGNVYLYVTPNSTSWPVEVSIAAGALAEGSEIITGNVPAGYELKLVDGVYGVCSVEAKIGEVTYATLAAAVNAANEGDTITLVTDITFTEATRTLNSGSWYDGLYYIGDKSFTIDLASYTIGHDNSVNDYLLNFKNNGAKANVINLINGTIEAGSTAYCALATSSSNTNKITINTENINIINNNSNGSTIKVRGGVELNVNAGTVITGKDSYLGIECVASTVNIYDGAEIYMNGSTSYNGCLVGACANGTVNVYGGYGEGVKGGFIAMTSGGTINVAGGEWIANTDGTVGDNSNLYVLTAQNNKNESGYAGASIINVTGGTFRGGMDAWILNDDNVEKAELNISGGNFNADPTSYVVSTNYKVVNEDDGTYTVEVDGFEKFYTAAGVETTQDQAAYSLMFNVTDNENNELSVKIGNKKPAQNSSINLVTPVTATFDGITFNVTSIADNGFNSTRFKTVTISEGVATIGTKALANMSALTDIVFPSTLKSIGDNCFYGYGENHKIKTITCYAEEAPVAASHYTEVPFQMVICKVAALIVPNAVSYEEYATAPGWSRFYEEPNGGLINHILGIGTELEIAGKENKYTMIATITSMDPKECSIQIGNTKPASNSNAELVLPEIVDFFPSVEGLDFTVTSIPKDAFKDCKNFVGDLVIPAAVRTIGYMAFNASHNANAGSLIFADGCKLTTIDAWAFNNSFKGDFQLPASITSIGVSAFANNGAGNTLTITAENSGYGRAFAGSKFIKLVVEEGVKSLPGLAFLNTKFTEVVLPSTLETMSGSAFHETKTITTITINAAVPPTVQNANNYNAFEQEVFDNATLFVPDHAAKALYKEANVWKEFVNISTPIITQTTQLNAGWNWFSYYVNTDLTALETALGENGVQITSKTDGFVAYNSQYGWSGILSSITESQMYMINVGASHDLELSGELVGPTSITLHQGWNWIGFPMSEAVSVTDALAGFGAKPGDQIKSKDNGFASYNSQYGWGGTLSTLNPGEGYMYQSNNSETTELFYSAGTRGELKANVTTDGNHWIPNAGQYPNNMTMTAMVEVEGGDYEVAAFVNGECRGSARPIYIEALDAHILFLTIHGEDVEEMTFKFYDLATGEEFDLNDRMNYSNDAIVGTLAEPYIFSRGTTGIGEASLSDINIYPNPTTTGTEINLQATCDTVEVFNALGVKVAEYHNVDSIDAFETAGIYVIRITDNGDVKHCRLIVK